jgi:hypothetical protein
MVAAGADQRGVPVSVDLDELPSSFTLGGEQIKVTRTEASLTSSPGPSTGVAIKQPPRSATTPTSLHTTLNRISWWLEY